MPDETQPNRMLDLLLEFVRGQAAVEREFTGMAWALMSEEERQLSPPERLDRQFKRFLKQRAPEV
jgi:hypothetical protein